MESHRGSGQGSIIPVSLVRLSTIIMLSAEQSPQVVDDYLSQEVQWGKVPETGPEEQGSIAHAIVP